ncbi:carboxylate-amine ligase [Streptomyces sp. B3I7]|uniref:glutamate--cysteine ligase n=1 Tax=unclassified Streptomyces TaxID=2593676 RepID=UPI002786B523|nr:MULTISPECIES: glutamate--cysteine ligase [unclassified Streptomyces]MDQ0785419.1 carboxylate-amine ligase [Streptomyces sp. B3I8]MDQ0814992.1 carboxylate-amine ligase [Streptomyces sp. B3I7]
MRTVGVEEELLLVDPDSGEPCALAAAVLARAAQDGGGDDVFEKELHSQMLEFATHPQSGMQDLGAEILRFRKEAARHAGDVGAVAAALATSPLPVTPKLTVNSRYEWMAREFGLLPREQLVCGCHVHVSVDSDDEAVAVLDRIRPWLPVLTALSANSPFWQGKDSGYASYRSRVWARWPMAGPTALFGSAEAYHRLVGDMVATGALHDEGMVYFDARISRTYPTVELRVADVCLDASTTVLVATLARGLVETAAREAAAGVEPVPHDVSLMRLAAWRAARSGVEGELLDPVTMRPRPAPEVVGALLDHVDTALNETGDAEHAREAAATVLREGNGAVVQRRLLEEKGNLGAVVAECARRAQG